MPSVRAIKPKRYIRVNGENFRKIKLLTFQILTALFLSVYITPLTVKTELSGGLNQASPMIINVGGDFSLTEIENSKLWNPHVVGLTEASFWHVSMKDEMHITLKAPRGEAGHVATGAWWCTNFNSNSKLSLYASNLARVKASFRANILEACFLEDEEWLRIALACAVQRSEGFVVYTEMDFWDSPNTLKHPYGNIQLGGDIIYQGGDVVEYKVDQAPIGEWRNYSLDLTTYIDRAWRLKPGDLLESVYIVVETTGSANVSLKVDDFWITLLE
ncbi:MAG: hypothetical protein QXN87_07780 [Candidatus Bathyarchaeia archaeon]